MPTRPGSLIPCVSLVLPSLTWTLCLGNGNNELVMCWLSVFEERTRLKTFRILKQFGCSFSFFSPLFSSKARVYSLGHWQCKLDFQHERTRALLRGVSGGTEEEESSPGGILSL